LAEVKPAMDL